MLLYQDDEFHFEASELLLNFPGSMKECLISSSLGKSNQNEVKYSLKPWSSASNISANNYFLKIFKVC